VPQLYFSRFLGHTQRPGPKGHINSPHFRGLKPPAPSEILDSKMRSEATYIAPSIFCRKRGAALRHFFVTEGAGVFRPLTAGLQ